MDCQYIVKDNFAKNVPSVGANRGCKEKYLGAVPLFGPRVLAFLAQ
jgi:hypothetical protein